MSPPSDPSSPVSEAQVEALTEVLKAVAHPLRLRILLRLTVGPATVTTLSAELSTVQALVSQHLRILRMHNLVAVTRKEGFATYRVADPRLGELLACLARWEIFTLSPGAAARSEA